MKNKRNKILIIEDEMPVSKVLKDNLEATGDIDVFQAFNGQDGLEQTLELKPDLIMLDLVMPKMDGMHFLRLLRANSSIKNTKVIVLTNLASTQYTKELNELNVYYYIVKSNWKIEEVMDIIKKLL